MAAGCGLSYRCRGEPRLGKRESAAGVAWTACGESIAEAGAVPDNPKAVAQTALALIDDMLDEQPPHDSRRADILSKTFRYVGIAIHRSNSGLEWLTLDFAN
jgi:hypothetical protein